MRTVHTRAAERITEEKVRNNGRRANNEKSKGKNKIRNEVSQQQTQQGKLKQYNIETAFLFIIDIRFKLLNIKGFANAQIAFALFSIDDFNIHVHS